METVVLQGDDPASALISYITDMRIATLVLGSCSLETTSCFGRFEIPNLVFLILFFILLFMTVTFYFGPFSHNLFSILHCEKTDQDFRPGRMSKCSPNFVYFSISKYS